ncbi:orotate phosphoribosyltransferase [Pseudonocardia sp. HH130630-07]|uniref:orotate phosphoribosyltransferase n=1 Tax=Pseudonocardia sp. HH130630-07 TaxID=1690815 RepID=UPI000839D2EA|nr:orotate phosphoribosyltransferase [Pseudonocardia sp. HH130630-07]
MERDELAAALHHASHLTGSFRLRSGRTATEYFDKYRFESDPRILREIAEHAAALVPAGTEVLAGLELGGIPVATAMSLATGLPVVFVRKAAKEYGTRRLAEGADVDGRSVLVVEDVVTSGGQVALSTSELRAIGARIDHALCVVDREEGGAEALADSGVGLISVFTAETLRTAGLAPHPSVSASTPTTSSHARRACRG